MAEFHEIDSVDLALFDVCELLVTSSLKVVNATGRHLDCLGTDSGFLCFNRLFKRLKPELAPL